MPAAGSAGPQRSRTSPAPYSWEDVLAGRHAQPTDLWLRSDKHFQAGSLHVHRPIWDQILTEHPQQALLHQWLRDGVDLPSLWVPYRGRFRSATVYDAPTPAPRTLPNHLSCVPFSDFIGAEISANLRSGAIGIWDPAWEPPLVVSPLGIEPEKPRLIFDARFPNLWLPDRPFVLPRVQEAATWVGDFVTSCDDKSGFFHVLLSQRSWTYTAFEWQGTVYYYRVLPFGLKLSPWIYQLFSEAPVLFLRRRGLRCWVYIDDSLVSAQAAADAAQATQDAMFAFADLRSRLGFVLSRSKSHFEPKRVLLHLGIIVDCHRRMFRVPEEKIARFKTRITDILGPQVPRVSDIQRIAGNIAFFAVAVPSAMLFARSLFALVALADRRGWDRIKLSEDARSDLARWQGLDASWNGIFWRSQVHTVLETKIHTDASLVAWAGVVLEGPPQIPRLIMGDTFAPEIAEAPIHVLEMHGLAAAVAQLAPAVEHGWLRVMCDNAAVVAAFKHDGARDPRLNAPLKVLFDLQFRLGFALAVDWVSTKDNEADAPSRDGWWHECRLSDPVFARASVAQEVAGPFTIDLMASAWNARCPRYYSRFRSASAVAMDIFAQNTATDAAGRREHGWCYPPFAMIPAVLDHLFAQRADFTIVVPERIEDWWPALISRAAWSARIAAAGEKKVFRFPPGMHMAARATLESLWAFTVTTRR